MTTPRWGWVLLAACGGEVDGLPRDDAAVLDGTIEADAPTDGRPEILSDADTGLLEAAVDADAAEAPRVVPEALWARGLGPVFGAASPLVAVDAAGNVHVAALTTVGSTIGGCAPDQGVLASFDPLGKPRWSRCLLGEGISAIAAGPGDRVAVGGCRFATGTCEATLRVFEGSGVEVWSRSYPSALATTIPAVAFASTGHLVFALDHQAAIDLGTGSLPPRASIVRLRADGTLEWVRSLGDQSLAAVAVDATDRIYVAGTAGGLLDYGDGVKSRPGQAWVASYTSANAFRFVHGLGAGSGRLSLAVDPSGGSVSMAVGVTSGAKLPSGSVIKTGGPLLVTLDAVTGVDSWHLSLERRVALAAVGASELVVAGRSGAGVLLQRYDAKGKALWPGWTPSTGSTSAAQEATSVAVTPSGKLAIAGVFRGVLDFGAAGKLAATDLVTDAGPGADLFVAQLSP